MKTIINFRIKSTYIFGLIIFIASINIIPANAQTVTVNRREYLYIPLEHFWSSSRTDNFSTATQKGTSAALSAKYRPVRRDGYILYKPNNAEGQSVPLYLYYSQERKDNFITSTSKGIRDAVAAGYKKVRIEGYVLKTVNPKYKHLYKPLWLYYSNSRKDNFTIATPKGIKDAEAAGYRKIRIEGYVLKAPDHTHRINESLTPSILNPKYIGNYPSDRQTGWSDKLQGVAHDQNNWFFTQKIRLWKFPLTHDLNKYVSLSNLPSGVKSVKIPSILSSEGYNHFGDLVEYKGFLFIPLEAEQGSTIKKGLSKIPKVKDRVKSPKNSKKPLLAVFKASDLSYVGSAQLQRQTKAGWCAINPKNGLLYTSTIDISNKNKLLVYNIDLNALINNKSWLSYKGTKLLWDDNGKIITIKGYMQGGEFSDDGKYLFIINGKGHDFDTKDGGIWIFNFRNGKKILKSATSGNFKYQFKPGYRMEEPEGLTYWNLDNRNAPGIKGKLHAILLNSDATNRDEFWFKHYTIDY